MGSYNIRWKRSAVKELRSLPKETTERIVKAVEQLSTNPFPSGVSKLTGSEHTYRIRVGSYRVIYSVAVSDLLIEIIKVGHRKDVYNP